MAISSGVAPHFAFINGIPIEHGAALDTFDENGLPVFNFVSGRQREKERQIDRYWARGSV